jgi:hypothetical protein
MLAKNLQVTKLIPQTQLVIRLKFVAVIRSADALQIFPTVRIPCSQLPDEPCRSDVIYMATHFQYQNQSTKLFPISCALGKVRATGSPGHSDSLVGI